mmetsp:Transcript_67304/g.140602  ORF Transcript_67304/g.140602 Transcript_67304/m.140602 type:complete len:279 (+) Transcript_67304:731-1567(+)
MIASAWASSSSLATSDLFSNTKSAHSSCSAKSAETRSVPSSFPFCPPVLAGTGATKSWAKAVASMTVMVLATCARRDRFSKASRTAMGSATPLSSTTMASGGALREPPVSKDEGLSNSPILKRRSSDAEQQTQPFESSTLLDWVPAIAPSTTRASTFTLAKSLTMMPNLTPWSSLKRCCKSVVFPAPRKPDSSTTGTPRPGEGSTSLSLVGLDLVVRVRRSVGHPHPSRERVFNEDREDRHEEEDEEEVGSVAGGVAVGRGGADRRHAAGCGWRNTET